MGRNKILKSGQARWLRLRQLDDALAPLKALKRISPPATGWIREIREALGMRTADLGKRSGWAQSTVPAIEKNEAEGRITIETLQKAARALDCEFVYAFVPHGSLEETKRERINEVATQKLRRVRRTMALEGQEVGKSVEEEQFADLVQQLSLQPPSSLWSEQ
jgi:predicted DNA-binding mobile mystery protein A